MSYIGTNKIGKMYLGGTEIAKAYLGSNLVYQNIHYSKISGVTPLTFQSKSGDIRSLIQYGKCEQRNNLPPGCVEIEYLESTGTQYIDTGIVVTSTDNMFIDFQKTTSYSYQAFYAGRRTNENNATSYSLGQINGKFDGRLGSGNLGYGTSINLNRHTLELDPVNGNVIQDSSTTASCGSFASSNLPVYLFGVNTNGSAGYSQHPIRVFEFSISDKIHLIPVRVGTTGYMYDKVSGQLFGNSGTGDFVLGPDVVPTPDKPIDIWCNNGVLKARHQSGLPLGYTLLDYIQSTGTQYINTGIVPSRGIKWELDNEFTGVGNFGQGGSYNGLYDAKTPVLRFDITMTNSGLVINYGIHNLITSDIQSILNHRMIFKVDAENMQWTYGDTTGTIPVYTDTAQTRNKPIYLFARNDYNGVDRQSLQKTYSSKFYENGNLIQNLIPVKNPSNVIGMYDLISNTFFTNQGTGDFIAGNEVSDPVVIYTDGTQEVVTDSLGNTASAEMLLAVGDYKDTQEVISGSVTRNVGVKVFDGTENWDAKDTYGRTKITVNDLYAPPKARTISALCTHFANLHNTEPIGTVTVGQFYIASPKGLFFHISQTTTNEFKQFLADQYAAGTPVIVIYPLATETTESVTAQHLTTTSGENTIDITANVSDISVEVECLT